MDEEMERKYVMELTDLEMRLIRVALSDLRGTYAKEEPDDQEMLEKIIDLKHKFEDALGDW